MAEESLCEHASDVVNFNSLFIVENLSWLVFRLPLLHDEALADSIFRERGEADAVRLLLARHDSPLVLLGDLGIPDRFPLVLLGPVQPAHELLLAVDRGEVDAADVVLVVLSLSYFAAAGVLLLKRIGRALSLRFLRHDGLEEVCVVILRACSAPFYDHWGQRLERQVVAHCNSDKSLSRRSRLLEERLERVKLLAWDVQVRILLWLVLH